MDSSRFKEVYRDLNIFSFQSTEGSDALNHMIS